MINRMKSYSNLYTFGREKVDFALRWYQGKSEIFHGDGLQNVMAFPHQIDACYPIRYPFFAYYDYSGDRVGVISLESGALWEEKISVGGSDYIGVNVKRSAVDIQMRGDCRSYDVISGELVESRAFPGKLYGRMGLIEVGKDKNRVRISLGEAELDFTAEESLWLVDEIGDFLIIGEHQSSLKVIAKNDGNIVIDISPSVGSRFSGFHICQNGEMIIGVSCFDRPEETEFWKFGDVGGSDCSKLAVRCAGSYVLVRDGTIAAFACGRAFDLLDGLEIDFV